MTNRWRRDKAALVVGVHRSRTDIEAWSGTPPRMFVEAKRGGILTIGQVATYVAQSADRLCLLLGPSP